MKNLSPPLILICIVFFSSVSLANSPIDWRPSHSSEFCYSYKAAEDFLDSLEEYAKWFEGHETKIKTKEQLEVYIDSYFIPPLTKLFDTLDTVQSNRRHHIDFRVDAEFYAPRIGQMLGYWQSASALIKALNQRDMNLLVGVTASLASKKWAWVAEPATSWAIVEYRLTRLQQEYEEGYLKPSGEINRYSKQNPSTYLDEIGNKCDFQYLEPVMFQALQSHSNPFCADPDIRISAIQCSMNEKEWYQRITKFNEGCFGTHCDEDDFWGNNRPDIRYGIKCTEKQLEEFTNSEIVFGETKLECDIVN